MNTSASRTFGPIARLQALRLSAAALLGAALLTGCYVVPMQPGQALPPGPVTVVPAVPAGAGAAPGSGAITAPAPATQHFSARLYPSNAEAARYGTGEVYVVSIGHPNIKGEIGDLVTGFQKRFNEDYSYFSSYTGLRLLSQAMANAKSTNPVRVAAAMEGLNLKGYAGDVTMRKDDHQLQQTMFITKWAPVSAANPYNVENTGYTFAPVKQIDVAQASTPTSCQMKRP